MIYLYVVWYFKSESIKSIASKVWYILYQNVVIWLWSLHYRNFYADADISISQKSLHMKLIIENDMGIYSYIDKT